MSRSFSFVRVFTAALFIGLGTLVPRALGDTIEWTNPLSGDFDNAANWTVTAGAGAPPPAAGDEIDLNEAGAYTITLNGNEAADRIFQTDGDVSLLSDSTTVRTLDLTTGASDLIVRTDGVLNIGSATNPAFVNVGDTLLIATGSGVGDGTIIVRGADSRLDVLGTGGHPIAVSGRTGTLTLDEGSTGNVAVNGTLNVGVSVVAATLGLVNVNGGATLKTGNLDLATNDSATSGTGVVTVSGAGSRLEQTLAAASLTIGNPSGGSGQLVVSDSGTFTSAAGGQIAVDATGQILVQNATLNANGAITMAAGSSLTLDGGVLNAAAGLDNSGGGMLDLLSGTLTVTGGAFIPGAGGAADDLDLANAHLVLGAGATMDLDEIEIQPNASLTIQNGGSATTSTGAFNALSGSDATVDGIDSEWVMTGDLSMSGDNVTLTIQNGGQVSNASSFIGLAASPSADEAEIIITGSGSRWTNTSQLNLSGFGSQRGLLGIFDQGDVSSDTAIIGTSGKALIDGEDTTWTNHGDLSITSSVSDAMINGINVSASLTIQNQGNVLSQNVYVSRPTSGDPAATRIAVQGDGSALTVENDLYVGGGSLGALNSPGNGSLVIENGGAVTSLTGYVGAIDDSVGTDDAGVVTVSGIESEWIISNDLYIGGNGTAAGGVGNVTVTDDAVVEVGGSLRIWDEGFLQIDGGTLKVDSTAVVVDGLLNFVRGGLHLTDVGGYTVGANNGPIDQILGGSQALISGGDRLRIENTLTIPSSTALRVIGSTVEASAIVNDNLFLSDTSSITITTELTNNDDLVLIDSTVDGPVNNANGGAITIVGDVAFNGSVTGPGNFFGPGTANFNSGFSPGASPAVVAFEGDLAFGLDSTLEIEIGGATPGAEFDRVEVAGVAQLDGTLSVELIDLGGGVYEPQLGDSFGFLAATGGAGGLWHTLDLPALAPGLEWMLNPGGVTVFLNVVAALPGDYNFDGVVDAADYAVWRETQGQTGVGLVADGDGDGDVDPDDYSVWAANLGATLPAPSFTVPEPTAALLIASGILVRFSRRRPSQ